MIVVSSNDSSNDSSKENGRKHVGNHLRARFGKTKFAKERQK